MPRLNLRGPAGVIAAIVALVLVALGAAALVDSDGDGRPDSVTVKIPGLPDVVTDADGQADPGEVAEAGNPAPAAEGPDVHEDARDEQPSGVDVDEAAIGSEQIFADGLKAPEPVGGAQRYSCSWHPVRNVSSRGGARPLIAVLHYTVSRNVPGTADLAVIHRLFNTASFQASSHYLVDFEGNCWQLVRERDKAWTQGNFNPRSISVEIIAMGTESKQAWLDSPLIRRGILAGRWADVLKRNGLGRGRVDPVGCIVQRSGWTDHNALECGNTHHDVTPAFPYGKFGRQVRREISGPSGPRLTPSERAAVKCVKVKGAQPDCHARLQGFNRRLHDLGIDSRYRRGRHAKIHRVLRNYS